MKKVYVISMIFGVQLITTINFFAAHESNVTPIMQSLATCSLHPATPHALGHQLLVGTQVHNSVRIAFALAQGACIDYQDEDGNTALHYATTPVWITEYCGGKDRPCINISPKIIRQLITAGANPHIANKAGLTPLSAAQLRLRALRMAGIDTHATKLAEPWYALILETLDKAIAEKQSL